MPKKSFKDRDNFHVAESSRLTIRKSGSDTGTFTESQKFFVRATDAFTFGESVSANKVGYRPHLLYRAHIPYDGVLQVFVKSSDAFHAAETFGKILLSASEVLLFTDDSAQIAESVSIRALGDADTFSLAESAALAVPISDADAAFFAEALSALDAAAGETDGFNFVDATAGPQNVTDEDDFGFSEDAQSVIAPPSGSTGGGSWMLDSQSGKRVYPKTALTEPFDELIRQEDEEFLVLA